MFSRISSTSKKRSVRTTLCRRLLPLPGARLTLEDTYLRTSHQPATFSPIPSLRAGIWTTNHARVVTLQIALAVEYLHSQGIAHRDIKQENVLVTSTDFGGRVLLTDFGFAAYANVGNGRMMSKVGTEGFVAPYVLESASSENYKLDRPYFLNGNPFSCVF